MALYLTKLVNGQVQKLRVSPTKAIYRGFWAVIVGGFAGTSVTCNGVTKFIGSSERVAFNIITPGTYTFTATRQGTTITKEVVLNDDTQEYIINLSMFIGMQQIEYIESTGTQYIDTGVVFNVDNVKLVLDWENTTSTTAAMAIFGAYREKERSIIPCIRPNGDKMEVQVANTVTNSYTYSIDTRHSLEVTVNGTAVSYKVDNGTTGSFTYRGTFNTTETNYLFAFYRKDIGARDLFTGKIYACKIYDNDTLVRDFIPIKDDTGHGALYDKVTQQIFYNSGTGDFICGPNKSYTRIQYLESTGTQYIDTGILGEGTWNIVAQSEETNKNRILVARGISGHVWFAATSSGYWGVSSDHPTSVPNTTKVNATIIFETDKISGTVNGQSFERTESIPVNWNNYMLLGYDNNYLFIGKLFSAKFIQNNILIRDFIPVLDYDGTPCMLDQVEGKLYYNQGTGEFVAGPEYVELEYIEGLNNEQYINTGIVPTSDMEIYLKMCTATYNSSAPDASVGCRKTSTGDDGFCVFYGTLTNTRIDMSWLGSNPTITRWKLNASYAAGDIFEISVKNSLAEIVKNGTSIGTHQFVPDVTCDQPICINGLNNAGSIFTQKNIRMRQYRFTIKGVCDLIPMRMGTEVGMYDLVTDTFFTNAGTGSFIAGPEK